MAIKSAYDLAMERLGGTKDYSEEQKARLAEIDKVYDAKTAEARLGAEARMKEAAGDPGKVDEIQKELAADLGRLEEKREREKDKVRRP
jgi:hypothetical protein